MRKALWPALLSAAGALAAIAPAITEREVCP